MRAVLVGSGMTRAGSGVAGICKVIIFAGACAAGASDAPPQSARARPLIRTVRNSFMWNLLRWAQVLVQRSQDLATRLSLRARKQGLKPTLKQGSMELEMPH